MEIQSRKILIHQEGGLDESCFPDFNGNMNPDSWSPEIPVVLCTAIQVAYISFIYYVRVFLGLLELPTLPRKDIFIT